jgi:hypothetical protein
LRHYQDIEPIRITATCAPEELEEGGVQYLEVWLMVSLKAVFDKHVSAAESK